MKATEIHLSHMRANFHSFATEFARQFAASLLAMPNCSHRRACPCTEKSFSSPAPRARSARWSRKPRWPAARGWPGWITPNRTIADTPDRMELGGVDLSDAAQAKQAIDAVVAHFGRLDVLINIAGAFSFETIAEGDPKTWARLYAINVLTALNASRAAIPHLAASRRGGSSISARWARFRPAAAWAPTPRPRPACIA